MTEFLISGREGAGLKPGGGDGLVVCDPQLKSWGYGAAPQQHSCYQQQASLLHRAGY